MRPWRCSRMSFSSIFRTRTMVAWRRRRSVSERSSSRSFFLLSRMVKGFSAMGLEARHEVHRFKGAPGRMSLFSWIMRAYQAAEDTEEGSGFQTMARHAKDLLGDG